MGLMNDEDLVDRFVAIGLRAEPAQRSENGVHLDSGVFAFSTTTNLQKSNRTVKVGIVIV
jgi:hypothetical protein